MDAVLLLTRDGQAVVYGAAAGRPFQSIEDAEEAAVLNEACLGGAPAVAAEIQPHDLQAVGDETRDAAGESGIHGQLAVIGLGSPDGTLRDGDARSLHAVLLDGEGHVYGAAEGNDHSVFGELARAEDVIAHNDAAHLTAVEVRPFDELVS